MKKVTYDKSLIGKTVWVPNGQLTINPNRIRRKFSQEVIDELVATFKSAPRFPDEFPDVILPVINGSPVMIGDKFMVGLHNTITLSFQKARRDPREEIRVKFVEYPSIDDMLLQSFKENEDRGSLDVLDKAKYLTRLKETLKTDINVSKFIGKSEQYVQKLISLERLPDEIKSKVSAGKEEGKIPLIYANMIFSLRDKGFSVQKHFSEIVERFDVSIKEAQELASILRNCKEGQEGTLFEQFKKKMLAKDNLGAIERSFSQQKKNMTKEPKKPSIDAAASDFAHHFTEVSAGMQTLLSDMTRLEGSVGKHDLGEILDAMNTGDKKRVRDALKSYRFCKKKLTEYLEEPLSRRLEELQFAK